MKKSRYGKVIEGVEARGDDPIERKHCSAFNKTSNIQIKETQSSSEQ